MSAISYAQAFARLNENQNRSIKCNAAGSKLQLKPDHDIVFLELIKESKRSRIYRVLYDDEERLLKVFPPAEQSPTALQNDDDPLDEFEREKRAYERIHVNNLEKFGFTPKYFGSINALNPKQYPSLRDWYTGKRIMLRAIVLEFIPNLEPLSPTNYTVVRGYRLSEAIWRLHQIGVLHRDIAARHMCLQESTDRIVIIDFDAAYTTPDNSRTSHILMQSNRERGLVDQFNEDLTKDVSEHTDEHSWSWYYYGTKDQYCFRSGQPESVLCL